ARRWRARRARAPPKETRSSSLSRSSCPQGCPPPDGRGRTRVYAAVTKYQPDYPGRFDSPPEARGYLGAFFGWHNDDHHHEGLALFTPADVYFGRVADVAARRQAALDAAFAAHPERFVRGRPVVPLPPREVAINPLPGPSKADAPSAPAIPSSEPPPEASLRPSPAASPGDRAQPSSRAAQPASGASEPLTRVSTGARSGARRASPSLPVTPP
ncbi:MAG TPA: hypothetical protein VFS43_12005, partial [Polyangiaceae bacterium]|nr:hypothetical protein [Polyangiaceae bacterium]